MTVENVSVFLARTAEEPMVGVDVQKEMLDPGIPGVQLPLFRFVVRVEVS